MSLSIPSTGSVAQLSSHKQERSPYLRSLARTQKAHTSDPFKERQGLTFEPSGEAAAHIRGHHDSGAFGRTLACAFEGIPVKEFDLSHQYMDYANAEITFKDNTMLVVEIQPP